MTNNEFYDRCAEIINTQYNCESFKYKKRTRWNNRKAGSGRFPDFGTIRVYGKIVHISLTKPIFLNVVCQSKQEALGILLQQQFD